MVNHISQKLLIKWQGIADLIAELLNIPAALIMRTEEEYMEVLVSSKSANNPYKAGDKEKWYGLYCETVIKSQNKLLIPNALKNKHWDKNPDIGLGMIAYLGYPINYPDNTPFGTLCVLDLKENSFSSTYEKLLIQFKDTIENDLLLFETFKTKKRKQDEVITVQDRSLKIKNEELQATEEELTASNDALKENIEQLYISEEKLNDAERIALVGHWEFHLSEKKVVASQSAKLIYGINPQKENLTIDKVKTITMPEYIPNMDKALVDLITNGKTYNQTFKIQRANDGEIRDIHSMAEFRKEKNMVFGVIHDITKIKKTENELNNKNLELESVFRVAPTGIGIVNNRVLTEVNPLVCIMTGYTKKELIGKNARILYLSKEEFERVGKEKYEQIAKKGTGTIETQWKKKDGGSINILLGSTPININDLSKGVIFTALDISEQKENEIILKNKNEELQATEEELRERHEELQAAEEELMASNDALKENITQLEESETRFKALHNASFGGIAIHDKGLILECNKGLSEMTGFKLDELIGMNGLLLISESTRDLVVEKIASEYEKPYEAIGVRKNGEEYPMRLEAREIPYKGKQVRVVEFRDITERKKSQQLIAENEIRYRSLQENMQSGVVVYKPINNGKDFEIIGFNKAAEKISQIKATDALGTTIKNLLPEIENSNVFKCLLDVYEKGKSIKMKPEGINQKGKKRYTENQFYKLPNGEIVVIFEDVTERIKAEEEILSERNRSISILHGTNAGTWEWDIEINKFVFNERFAEIIGYRICEIDPDFSSWEKSIHPNDIEIANSLLENHFSGNSDFFEAEFRQKHKKGHWVWVASRGKVTEWSKAGKPLFMSGTHLDITKRKKAELDLISNENQLQLIFDNSPAIMMLLNEKTQILKVNKTGLVFTGRKPNEILHKGPGDIFSCVTARQTNLGCGHGKACKTCKVRGTILETISTGKSLNKVEAELSIINNEVTKILTVLISTAIATTLPELTYLVTIDDITERKKSEQTIIESEKRFRTIIESANDAIFIAETESGIIIETNKKAEELLHKTRNEIIGMHQTKLHPEKDLEFVKESFNTDGNNISTETVREVNLLHATGKVIPTELSPALFKLDDGKEYLVGFFRDIRQRKQAEKALADSYTKYKTLADYNYDWEYWKSPKGDYIYNSPSCKRITGYTESDFNNDIYLFNKIICKEDKKYWDAHLKDTKNIVKPHHTIELRIKTKTGKIRWISHVCQPVFDANKKFIGNRGTNRDITQRKQSQLALIDSETRFKQLADFTQEGIVIHKNGIIQDVNKSLMKISGYNQKELIGKNFLNLFIQDKDRKLVLKKMKKATVSPYELSAKLKNGRVISVEVSIQSMMQNNEKIRVVSIRDITEQKQIQQKILNAIIQTEENERRRIAQELHDGIGPVLSTVKLYTQTYINTNNEEFKQKIEAQLIDGIDDALLQVSTISNNLSPHVLKDFGIKIAIQKFIGRVQKISKINIEFNYLYDEEIKDEIETTLYRVVIELINNTVKHAKATEIILTFDQVNEFIQIVYTDNGKGFDFDVTKKESTGMGLFNIVNRIKSFNGQVNFERGIDRGIAYNILVPAQIVTNKY